VVRDRIFEEPEVDIVTIIRTRRNKQSDNCYIVIMSQKKKTQQKKTHTISKIPEVEGEREVEGPKLDSEYYVAPLKIKKVNIGTTENPKIASIGDYWDNQIVERITELLREYSDLFPAMFSEMKGLAGELGEMKIPLKPDARPIRQRPYRLNPVYKQKGEGRN
jgi:hypothetical protein